MSNYIRNELYFSLLSGLQHGEQIVVSGPRMSGRSSLLHRLGTETDVRIRPTLVVSGLGRDAAPLEALGLGLRRAGRQTGTDSADILTALDDHFAQTDGIIAVDDAHRLDDESLIQLEQVVLGTRRACVITTSSGDARLQRPNVTLFPEALQLTLDPVGMQEATALIVDALEGPPEGETTARILAKSGGIPGVIVALAREGRRTGSLIEVDGVWRSQRHQWAPAAARTVLSLLDDVGPDDREVLTQLALLGRVDGETAEKLVGSAALELLEQNGLLKQTRDGDTARVRVSVHPEVLAEHLRNETGLFRRRRLFSQLSVALPDAALESAPDEAIEQSSLLLEGTQPNIENSNLAATIHQDIRAQLVIRLEQWKQHRTLGDAIELLDLLVARGAAKDEVLTLLSQAHELPPRSEYERVVFGMWEARWLAWLGGEADRALSLLRDLRKSVSSEFSLVLSALAAHLASVTGRSSRTDESWATYLRLEHPSIQRPLELIARGRFSEALETIPSGPFASQATANLAAYFRALALFFRGDLTEARDFSSVVLTDAVSRHDPQAVVLMSNTFAMSSIVLGQLGDALKTLSDVLALGYTAFPFTTVHVSNLVMLSMLQARRGHRLSALTTHRQAAAFGVRVGSIPLASPELAVAFIDYFDEKEGAAERIWAVTRQAAARGYDVAAVAAWLFAGPWSEERNDEIEAILARMEGDLFTPMLRYHRAMTSQDPDQLEASYTELLGAGRDFYAAVAAIERSNLVDDDRAEYQEWVDRARAIADQLGISGYEVKRFPTKLSRLSPREREIFDLLAIGSSNQEIAERLFLSIRTVENNLVKILRKLELRSRGELKDLWSQRSY